MKPGYKTTEFWITLFGTVVTALISGGLLTKLDADRIGDQIAGLLPVAAALLTNGGIAISYILSRWHLKTQVIEKGKANMNSTVNTILVLILLALGIVVVINGDCDAQYLLPWRSNMEKRLADERKRIDDLYSRPAPAPIHAPIIVQPPPPLQVLPPLGAPKQDLPYLGAPKQELPPLGAPKQELGPLGPPKQELAPLGPPRYELPAPGGKQELGPPMAPAVPAPQGYTRYALARPLD